MLTLPALKHVTRAALLTVTSGTMLAASLAGAGTAHAAGLHPAGYTSVESCTGVSGSISWTPGLLTTKARTEQAVLTGTLTGCSGYNGAQDGTGTVTAVLTGSSSLSSATATGTMTINWPATSGLNPSNATVTLRRTASTAPYTVSGTITSGAFTSAQLSTSLLPTTQTGTGTSRHPVTGQQYVNTTPLAARVNFG
jgi:hypothetical protein